MLSSFFVWYRFFNIFVRHRVCAFTSQYLDLILVYRTYTSELYAAIRCTSMYLYVLAMYFCCCSCVLLYYCCSCSSCCCMLLMFVIVCRMTKIRAVVYCIWSSVFFIQTSLAFDVRTPWQYCRICSLDLPITGARYRVSSVITGMRAAKACVSPPRRSPPCSHYIYGKTDSRVVHRRP